VEKLKCLITFGNLVKHRFTLKRFTQSQKGGQRSLGDRQAEQVPSSSTQEFQSTRLRDGSNVSLEFRADCRQWGLYGPPPFCKRKMRETELVCANVFGLNWNSDLLA